MYAKCIKLRPFLDKNYIGRVRVKKRECKNKCFNKMSSLALIEEIHPSYTFTCIL